MGAAPAFRCFSNRLNYLHCRFLYFVFLYLYIMCQNITHSFGRYYGVGHEPAGSAKEWDICSVVM